MRSKGSWESLEVQRQGTQLRERCDIAAAADDERRRIADRIKENGQVLGDVMDRLASASATDDVASLRSTQDTLKSQRADLYPQWGKLTDVMVRERGTIASLEAMHPSLKEPAPFVPGPNTIHF